MDRLKFCSILSLGEKKHSHFSGTKCVSVHNLERYEESKPKQVNQKVKEVQRRRILIQILAKLETQMEKQAEDLEQIK